MGYQGIYWCPWWKRLLNLEGLLRLRMVLYYLFRCFWNAILAYLFIYIDIVVSQPEAGVANGVNTGARIILVVIAIYGTAQMFIKLVLAMIHHIAWMTCNCCRGTMEEVRKSKVKNLWNELNN